MNEITIRFRLLIENKSWKILKQELVKLDPARIADIITDISSDNERIILFRLLTGEQAKQTFQRLSHDEQEDIINGLAANSNKVTRLLDDLDPDDRTAFFEELPGKVSQRLMQLMSPDERVIAIKLLGYPQDSIGRLMTPEYVAVKTSFTVEQSLEHIRKFGRDSETLDVIYVVDDSWKLAGSIRIKEIILASPQRMVTELTMDYLVSLNAYDDRDLAVKVFKEHDLSVLPVLDSNGVLVGIVTVDDVMNLVEEKAAEEFQKFGSLQDVVANPLKARVSQLYRQRIVWLIALVFMNVFSGSAIADFQNVIESVVAFVFFLPLLIDSGGNAGSQSATLMIRALAVGEVQMKDWFYLLGKELLVSLLLGLTMAVGVSAVSAFRAPEIMPVVAGTMVLAVVGGSVIGMLLPFIFTKFRADPATASAPLITSLCDIMGVLIYFSLASWYFGL